MKYRVLSHILVLLGSVLAAGCAPTTYQTKTTDHVRIGSTQTQLGYYKLARSELQAALLKNPSDPAAHYELGRLDAIVGNLREAQTHFYRVLENHPYNASAHTNLGWTLVCLDNFNDAQRHFQKAIELRDEVSNAYAGMGAVHLARSRQNEARRAIKNALNADPRNPFANLYLGLMYEGGGGINQTTAQRGLRQAVRLGFRHYSLVVWDARFKDDPSRQRQLPFFRPDYRENR